MDLNLVRVFVAVYETRSLTLAGARLYVTQSAISQSLSKLREQLDDPLFERTGREMRPTPLAEQLAESFRQALSLIDRTLDDVHGFQAETTERVFRIALSELGEIGYLPAIFNAMHEQAPNAKLEVIQLSVPHLAEWLSRGSVDLAITPANITGIYQRTHIKHQKYMLIVSQTHPLAEQPFSIDDYRNAPRVIVAGDSGVAFIEDAQRRAGVTANPVISIQHVATLPQLISENPTLIAVVPDTIAMGWTARWPLKLKPLPFEMTPIEINLYRRQSSENTASLEWFYNIVGTAIAGHEGNFTAIQGLSEEETAAAGSTAN